MKLLSLLLITSSLYSAEFYPTQELIAKAKAGGFETSKLSMHTLRIVAVELHKAKLLSVSDLVDIVKKNEEAWVYSQQELQSALMDIYALAKKNYDQQNGDPK